MSECTSWCQTVCFDWVDTLFWLQMPLSTAPGCAGKVNILSLLVLPTTEPLTLVMPEAEWCQSTGLANNVNLRSFRNSLHEWLQTHTHTHQIEEWTLDTRVGYTVANCLLIFALDPEATTPTEIFQTANSRDPTLQQTMKIQTIQIINGLLKYTARAGR